jgi:hypothetical protein
MVGANGGYYGQIARMAKTAFVFQTVDAAFPGADIAGDQSRLKSLSAAL